jgi:septum formation protein
MIMPADFDLALASTSRYRRELLSRLGMQFRAIAPNVDESARPGEMPAVLATRLAAAKAHEVAVRTPGAVIIGSDQVADLGGTVLGKPGTIENARAQLSACSGRDVVFHTAICVVDVRVDSAPTRSAIDTTKVRFRQLGAQEIARYIEREQPLDCAGSFKAESLGITLFERIESSDPTGLIGLPLIALCRLLREAGIMAV